MRLGQIRVANKFTAALFEGDRARPIPGYNFVELIWKAETESVALPDLAQELASRHGEPAMPAKPICPLEVWGCDCTFAHPGTDKAGEPDTYSYVSRQPRPAVFFKGTARVCVGPSQSLGIRGDSVFTVPEPELAVILGSKGKILGYTLANDVSAYDLVREHPLYLPQAKIYSGCCSLGPVIVPADALSDPYNLEIRCRISRGGKIIFEGSGSTSGLQRKVADVVQYLIRYNPVPAGSVLLTGTSIAVNEMEALKPGDLVSIQSPEIGELCNPVSGLENGGSGAGA